MAFEKNSFKNQRQGDIHSYTLHGWNGNIMTRIRANVNEKVKAVTMIDSIKSSSSLSDEEIKNIRDELRRKEAEGFKELEELAQQRKPFHTQPINWKRNSEGKIISPWDAKPLKKYPTINLIKKEELTKT